MKIQANQLARPFTSSDIFGEPISLADYEDKKLLLSFYRYASCPLCNLRIHDLIERYDDLKARGLHTLAIFQ
jgi:peroxiredoxin